MSVVARNSTFVFKGRSVDIRQVADELHVRYVLEGSVRRSGERIRVTAELVDGRDGTHLWAERYDGNLSEIFDVQDEIAGMIVGSISTPNAKSPSKAASLLATVKLSGPDVAGPSF